MPGLAFGRLFDMGYLRLPVGLASALLVACTFLTAECKEFWQFLLCQGFGIGVSHPCLFTTPRTSSTFSHITACEWDRVQRRIWCRRTLVPQEARFGFSVHGGRFEYRRDDLPHHPQESNPDPKVCHRLRTRSLHSVGALRPRPY